FVLFPYTTLFRSSLSILIAGVYLLNNYLKTGLMTGMERIPRKETISEFFIKLKDASLTELNILSVNIDDRIIFSMVVIVLSMIIFIRPQHVKALFSIPRRDFLLPGMFLFVGVVYFIGIVY